MRIGFLPAALALLLISGGVLRADLKRAMAEPNLEKRSGLALDNAAAALKAAREAYDKNDSDLTAKDAAEIQESVDLAYDSLVQSGKNPRNSSWCKKAEIATRDLSRRLESFQEQMSYTDRPMLDKVNADVQKVHDDLLMGVMEGQKKKKK
jgi:multidrug resistance efflux pump